MRRRFEFSFHTLEEPAAALGDVDSTLALLGAQGWEIRGIAPLPGGALTVALQRPLDEEAPLPDAPVLAAKMAEPLPAPTVADLEREPPRGEEAADAQRRD
ncbi:MAG TPA: hypothetical protein VMA36_14720 [Candidatus Limnocylindria bacterium]|jgi:hypothetical protein|nr:hypothetical protein [Candidatus Limnocylindria bacterium]